jgi:hypothetical protein
MFQAKAREKYQFPLKQGSVTIWERRLDKMFRIYLLFCEQNIPWEFSKSKNPEKVTTMSASNDMGNFSPEREIITGFHR